MPEPENEIINQTTEEIENSNHESRSQQRIKQLSDKVELTSKERDELKALREQDQKKISELERENAFNSGFTDMLAAHSAAKDYKTQIREKVMAGYTIEDATIAVLGKEGKLSQQAPQPTAQDIAGGSASTTQPAGQKSIKEMTQEERRAILEKELMFGS